MTGAEHIITREQVAIAMVRAAGAAFTNAGARGVFAASAGNGIARTGAGVYTLTLTQACPSATTNLVPTLYGAACAEIVVEHTSDTVKTIRTFDGANPPAAADFDFDLVVERVI